MAVVLWLPSAAANKLSEPSPEKPHSTKAAKAKKKEKKKKTAKQVRAEQLQSVIDPELGFGLAPAPQKQPELTIKTKRAKSKKSRRAAKRKARMAAKRHKRAMDRAMSVTLGARQKMQRTRAEETMVLDEQNLSDAQVKESIRVNRDSVDVCVERASARGKLPSGHANISFTVEPLGHVSNVRVTAAGAHGKRISRCMKQAIKRWKFPSSDAATDVEFPFVLDIAGTAMQ